MAHVGDELHGVVDGHAGADGPTRRVDVEPDVGVGVFAFEEQQLGRDEVGHVIVDVGAEEHDAVLQQAVEDVALRAAGRHFGERSASHRSPSRFHNLDVTTDGAADLPTGDL
jgi:hypothetical protein